MMCVVWVLLLCRFLVALSLSEEGLYLLQAKKNLDDPDGVLSNWNSEDEDPCNWIGITCSPSNGSVVSVEISDTLISGTFPSSLCRLPSLSLLSLSNNFINSSLPVEISRCSNLRSLDLSQNLLVGSIPGSLSEIQSLQHLNLSGNNFTGEIPTSFGRFTRLQVLDLTNNLLNGTIPFLSLSNLTTLKLLHLAYNPFSPNRLVPELGNLTNLEQLWLAQCNIEGEIPSTIGGLKKVINLDMAMNRIRGSIPPSLVELNNVVQIELYGNKLSGFLPAGMSKMTSLRRLDAAMNDLRGPIPADLCELPLESLHLYQNRFEGPLPESITRSKNLTALLLFSNLLNGSLPENLGKNSPLQVIDVSDNSFTGEIPASLCSKGALTELLLINNSFSGKIPADLSKCQSLTRVRLNNNSFSGDIPARFWALPHVYLLELSDNSFSGSLPGGIASMSNLSSLLLSRNRFNGSIPEETGSLHSLVVFSARDNFFEGKIPSSFINLKKLQRLDLKNNQLSGEIPTGISSLTTLNELNLANNCLSGEIRDEIGSLSMLNYLDLSGNRFSGKIPSGLQNLKVNLLNLSNNDLSGEIPALYTQPIYEDSFLGNPDLCGGDEYGSCLVGGNGEGSYSSMAWIRILLYIFAAGGLIAGVSCFCSIHEKKARNDVEISDWRSFQKLGFVEFELMVFLKDDNMIGSGSSGKVYKAVLSNGEVVAVKRLWRSSEKDAFEAEVETLGKIRHKNVVKLLSCCNSKGMKLLVYEYMANGSLGDLLHSGKGGMLDWERRYSIALDAAVGLSYLHHDCVPPIIHRDVKSNNILLDSEFRAKLSDFGIAKAKQTAESMSVIAGSYGYIAPEYGYTLRVSEKSDVYSFGVVVLELVTGRRPSDAEFGEKGFVNWVYTRLETKGFDQVVDPRLSGSIAAMDLHKEDVNRVLNLGLCCTGALPQRRPSMRQVVKLLLELSPEKMKFIDDESKIPPAVPEVTLINVI